MDRSQEEMEGTEGTVSDLSMKTPPPRAAHQAADRLLSETSQAPGEGESTVYSFSDPEVRRRLLKLVKTDVVRIMDKSFMNNLQEQLYLSHWEDFQEKLHQRRTKEAERRKKLALKGVQPLDDSSLDSHPILQVGRRAAREAVRWKARKRRPAPGMDPWEYGQFLTRSELDSEADRSEVVEISPELPDRDWLRRHERLLGETREEARQIGVIPAQDILETLKYEPTLVRKMKTVNKVEDLYRLAEEILRTETEKTPEEGDREEGGGGAAAGDGQDEKKSAEHGGGGGESGHGESALRTGPSQEVLPSKPSKEAKKPKKGGPKKTKDKKKKGGKAKKDGGNDEEDTDN